MKAMVMERQGTPLMLREYALPTVGAHELLIQVKACGICRTDLHILDGELKEPKLPLILGHQIVGQVIAKGEAVKNIAIGDRVGVPWLGSSCGKCHYCLSQRENLCDQAKFTGYQIDGGFAECCTADANFCFPIPEQFPDIQAAPLLCAGLIGYRALMKASRAKSIALYGFGASAHLVTQVAKYQGRDVFAFTKPNDKAAQELALQLGAKWAGGTDEDPGENFDAAIIFAPVGSLVPLALKKIVKGGTVVCAGIHMSDIPGFPYADLWGERKIESVANLTRQDGEAFLEIAPKIPIQTKVNQYALSDANQALDDLRHGRFTGAGVIVI